MQPQSTCLRIQTLPNELRVAFCLAGKMEIARVWRGEHPELQDQFDRRCAAHRERCGQSRRSEVA